MKIILIVTFLLLKVNCFSQSEIFFIPINNEFNLFVNENSKLTKINKIEYPITELYSIENNRFVIINKDSTQFIFGEYKSMNLEIKIIENLPKLFKPKSMKLDNNFIFIGGNWSSGDYFIIYDIKKRELNQIKIPEKVYFLGKAIDDFLVLNDKVIAVDNLTMPKYLLTYNKKELPKLETVEIFHLKSNGTYEEINKGEINENYLVLLSGTSGGYSNSTANHITVLKSQDFDKGFSVSNRLKIDSDWNDILLMKDKIYIAGKQNGLGVLKIKEHFFKKKINRNNGTYFNNKIGKWRISYSEKTSDHLVKLIKFDDDRIILIYKSREGNYSYKLR
jgi:hypothetical protein